jgi:EpsI family protein
VSIVTNIVRIYLIIALTEWTDKRIGLADDHLLFGWGVFCVVMLVLMWFGAKAEQPGLTANIQTESYHRRRQSPWSSWRGVGVAIGAVIAAACALPLSAAAELRQMPAAFYAGLDADVGPWQRAGITKSNWRPRLVPGDATFNAAYARAGSRPVEVVVVFYDTQHDGREASAAGNGPAENATWHVIDTSMRTLNTDESAVFVTLQSGAMLRSVIYWYEGAGCRTGSRLKAKICTAWQRLWGGASASAFVVLSTDQASDRSSAESTLREFAQWLPPFVQPPHAPATGS